MNGPDTATCGANGTWSVLPGHCKLHNSKSRYPISLLVKYNLY